MYNFSLLFQSGSFLFHIIKNKIPRSDTSIFLFFYKTNNDLPFNLNYFQFSFLRSQFHRSPPFVQFWVLYLAL